MKFTKGKIINDGNLIIESTNGKVDFASIGEAMGTELINRRISEDISIGVDETCLLIDPIIEDGVEITIAEGGSLKIL